MYTYWQQTPPPPPHQLHPLPPPVVCLVTCTYPLHSDLLSSLVLCPLFCSDLPFLPLALSWDQYSTCAVQTCPHPPAHPFLPPPVVCYMYIPFHADLLSSLALYPLFCSDLPFLPPALSWDQYSTCAVQTHPPPPTPPPPHPSGMFSYMYIPLHSDLLSSLALYPLFCSDLPFLPLALSRVQYMCCSPPTPSGMFSYMYIL